MNTKQFESVQSKVREWARAQADCFNSPLTFMEQEYREKEEQAFKDMAKVFYEENLTPNEVLHFLDYAMVVRATLIKENEGARKRVNAIRQLEDILITDKD